LLEIRKTAQGYEYRLGACPFLNFVPARVLVITDAVTLMLAALIVCVVAVWRLWLPRRVSMSWKQKVI